jgi:hypothetical protein
MKSYDEFINQTNEGFVGKAAGIINKGMSAARKVGGKIASNMKRPGPPKPNTPVPLKQRMAAGFEKNKNLIKNKQGLPKPAGGGTPTNNRPKPNMPGVRNVMRKPGVKNAMRTAGSLISNVASNVRGKTYTGGGLTKQFTGQSGLSQAVGKGITDTKINRGTLKSRTLGDTVSRGFNRLLGGKGRAPGDKPNLSKVRNTVAKVNKKFDNKPEPPSGNVTGEGGAPVPKKPQGGGGGGPRITGDAVETTKTPSSGNASSGGKSKGTGPVTTSVGGSSASSGASSGGGGNVRKTDRSTPSAGAQDRLDPTTGRRTPSSGSGSGSGSGSTPRRQTSLLDGQGRATPRTPPSRSRVTGSSGGSSNVTTGIGSKIAKGASRVTQGAGDAIKKGAEATANAAGNVVKAGANAAKNKAGELATTATNKIVSTGKGIGKNIKDAAGNKAREVGNRVKKQLNMAKDAAGNKAKQIGKNIKDELKSGAVEASKKIENKVKQGINQGKKTFSKFKQDSTPASQQTIDVKAETVPEKETKQLTGSKTPKQLSGSSPKQLALPAAGQSSGSSVRPSTRGEARRAINNVFRNRRSIGATRNKPIVKKFQRSAAAKSAANIASKEAKTASAAIDPSQKKFASRKRMGESYSYWREEFIWETDKKYPDKIKEIKPMSGKNTITINPEDESSKYKRGY